MEENPIPDTGGTFADDEVIYVPASVDGEEE